MTPAEHVRIVLGEHRRLGTPFAEAWPAALASLPRGSSVGSVEQIGEWRTALAWARPHYQDAYYTGGNWLIGPLPPAVVSAIPATERAA